MVVGAMPRLAGMNSNEMASALGHFTPVIIGYRGSIAHGMYVPSTDPLSIDDKDAMCVVIASPSHYFGLDHFEAKETKLREWDIVTYEIKKFVRLLVKSNPNVLSLLWLKPEHYVYLSPEGERLIRNRSLFSSKFIYKSFTGYAYGQLRRMESFNRQGYMGKKRKALVEKFHFDTKNASHLIRLLKMGIEFLQAGELQVYREHDSQQLMAIKRGEWSLEQVKTEATHLFRKAEEAYEKSELPETPDRNRINSLLIDILREHFAKE
jgi:predicted nucleotidyltransferase